MNANKQLINLAGIVLVAVLLVAGVALVAMPLYSQSQSIDAQVGTVAQSNMLYEQQIAALTSAEAEIDQIDADVADLRSEIAAFPKLDDAHRLISAAAKQVDVRIQTVEATAPTAWQPRGTPAVEGTEAAAPAEPAPAATEGAEATTSAGETPAPAEAPVDETTPNRQVLLTITIDTALPFAISAEDESADDSETDRDDTSSEESAEENARRLEGLARKAVDFIDALRVGPRLITPVDLKYEDGSAVITVLTYFRSEAS